MEEQIKGGLIVSCQALEDEPLHSTMIMGRMALAAAEGGAVGIRANSREDIAEIKRQVGLPIIGIVKRDYPDSEIYITATFKELEELTEVGCDIIALDATDRLRPGGMTLADFFAKAKERYPDQLFMADCATVDEAVTADRLGFDFIGTTLIGYTPQSEGDKVAADDFKLIREILARVEHPVIAEGNIDTPEKARRVLDLGCHAVVVGGAITRPQQITRRFVAAIEA